MGKEINRLLTDSCVSTDTRSMLRLCLVFIKVNILCNKFANIQSTVANPIYFMIYSSIVIFYSK